MVRAGERYEHEGVILVITDVNTIFSFQDVEIFEITYRLIDGDFRTPKGKFFMRKGEDIRNYVRDIIDSYLDVKNSLGR